MHLPGPHEYMRSRGTCIWPLGCYATRNYVQLQVDIAACFHLTVCSRIADCLDRLAPSGPC